MSPEGLGPKGLAASLWYDQEELELSGGGAQQKPRVRLLREHPGRGYDNNPLPALLTTLHHEVNISAVSQTPHHVVLPHHKPTTGQ